MGGRFEILWLFLSFAAASILLFASVLGFLNFSAAAYFAAKTGESPDTLFLTSIAPAILCAIIAIFSLFDFPKKLFVLIGYYSGLERIARTEMVWRDKLPGAKWFWMIAPIGELADSLNFQKRYEEAEKYYFQVAEYSKISGLWASILVGASLENYADRLAKTGRLIDYAEWKGRFRGATTSRRILIVLWLSLTVLACQTALKFTGQNVQTIATSCSYLGRYELSDSILESGLDWLKRFNPGAKEDIASLRVKLAQNNVRWGRLAEAEKIYLEIFPLDKILSAKLDSEISGEPGVLGLLEELGGLYLRKGNTEKAEAIFKKVIQLRPLPSTRLALSDFYATDGRFDLCKEQLDLAMKSVQNLTDIEEKNRLELAIMVRYGRLQLCQHNGLAAETEFNKGLKAMATAKGRVEDFKITFLIGLMEAAHQQNDASKESNFRSDVMKEVEKAQKDLPPLRASAVCHQAADALERCGQIQYADQLLLAGTDLIEKATSSKNPALSAYYVQRGEMALLQNNPDNAARMAEKSMELINSRGMSAEHPTYLDVMSLMGKDAVKLNMDKQALSFFTDVSRVIEKNKIERIDPKIQDALHQYLDLLVKYKNESRASKVRDLLARTKTKQSGYN